MTSQTIAVTIAASVLILVLAERVHRMFAGRPSTLDQPVIFFLIVSSLILVLRWPQITCPQVINPDEAQMLAQGMRFCAHPVPWRDVDGMTGGPLDSMFLSAPILFGAPASWATARTMLWAANCLTMFFLYLAMRVFGTRAEAQIALLPTIAFYAFALDANFGHYSSETLPVLLLSAGICLLAREWRAEQPSRVRLFLLGLICGTVPFAKLQASPLALFLLAAGMAQLFSRHRAAQPSGKNCWPAAALLCLGGLTTGLLILGWVWIEGALSDFWISYILASRSYAQELSSAERNRNIGMLFTYQSDFRPYLLSTLAAFAVWLGAFFTRKAKPGALLYWALLVVSAGALLAAFCVLAAGKAFLHYMLLLVPALAAFQGLAFLAAKQLLVPGDTPDPDTPARLPRWFLAAPALVLIPQLLQPISYVRYLETVYPRKPSARIAAVTDRVRTATRPGDTLAIWGWMPGYYVEAGLMPATRDAVGHYVVTAGPYRPYFRRRYLADLEQSRPAVFIDAVSDGAFLWWNWKRADAHEGFPELAAYINDNYALWWTIHLTADGVPVRIYLLKGRMAELHLPAGNVETFAAIQSMAQPR
jgi:hypothetical protein